MSLLKQKSDNMRESGIELLRIILMFQVVFLHICSYGGEPDTLLVTGFSAGGFATSLLADDVFKQNAGVCVYCYTGIFFGQLKIKSEHQERIAEDKKDVYPDAVLFADHTCRYAQHRCGAR